MANTYTIDTIQVHGIDVPVVRHEKKGPMIAHRRLAEVLGLSNRTFQNLIERMGLQKVVINLITTIRQKGNSTQQKGVDFLPLRKFEVLINSLNTGHIGKTLPTKERSALVDKIETLQADIRGVIESYYHDGVAINKKMKPTVKGKADLLKATVRHVSQEEFDKLHAKFNKNMRVTREMVKEALVKAEEYLAKATAAAKKDKRQSYARRLHLMEESMARGKQDYADGRYRSAQREFLLVATIFTNATETSRSYAKGELAGLRDDVAALTQRMDTLEMLFLEERAERRAEAELSRKERALAAKDRELAAQDREENRKFRESFQRR